MRAVVYRVLDDDTAVEIATVTLDAHGAAHVAGPERSLLDEIVVLDDRLQDIPRTNGVAYIEALPRHLSGSYVWAKVLDD